MILCLLYHVIIIIIITYIYIYIYDVSSYMGSLKGIRRSGPDWAGQIQVRADPHRSSSGVLRLDLAGPV